MFFCNVEVLPGSLACFPLAPNNLIMCKGGRMGRTGPCLCCSVTLLLADPNAPWHCCSSSPAAGPWAAARGIKTFAAPTVLCFLPAVIPGLCCPSFLHLHHLPCPRATQLPLTQHPALGRVPTAAGDGTWGGRVHLGRGPTWLGVVASGCPHEALQQHPAQLCYAVTHRQHPSWATGSAPAPS